jgi:lysophospholipase L1-like esterase
MIRWVVFVFLGDSITAGFQQGPGHLPPRYYPFTNMLESSIRMKLKENESDIQVAIENKGINGDSTSGMVNRFKSSVVPERPDYVVIMGGLNDLFTRISSKDIYANLVKLVQMTREIGATPIVLSTTPVQGSNDFNNQIMVLNTEVSEYCKSENVIFIDLFTKLLDGEMLAVEYSNDGVHLSDRGYVKIISELSDNFLVLLVE